jgi:hypothetical protein
MFCGKPFIAHRKDNNYDSDKCRLEDWQSKHKTVLIDQVQTVPEQTAEQLNEKLIDTLTAKLSGLNVLYESYQREGKKDLQEKLMPILAKYYDQLYELLMKMPNPTSYEVQGS